MIPTRRIGSTIHTLPADYLRRRGAPCAEVIAVQLGGRCLLPPRQLGRLSCMAACEAEWLRLSVAAVIDGLRRWQVGA